MGKFLGREERVYIVEKGEQKETTSECKECVMKPIRFSDHARIQMVLRGATEEEVIRTIQSGKWEAAKMDKFRSRHQYDFQRISLTNQKFYKYKTVESIFADEPNEIAVITVKVYYSNQEVNP